MTAPYIIWVPPFSKSAGVRALYKLADELIKLNFTVFLFCKSPNKLNYSYITKKEIKSLRKMAIVIYPEIVKGNPLKIEKVVRWILYFPGKLGGNKNYSRKEKIFTWDPLYYSAPVLNVSLIDHFLFYNDESILKTETVCFSHKNKLNSCPAFLKNCIQINMTYPTTREKLAELLRRTQILYSFDTNSLLLDEASICGANVKVITEKGEIQDYNPKLERFSEITLKQQLNNFTSKTQDLEYWKKSNSSLFKFIKIFFQKIVK